MAIYNNASISLLHNCLFVLGALPATMVRNIWLTAINPIDLVFSKECCSKKNKAPLVDCWYRHVKNTPTLTLHIIAYKCHEGSRNVNTYQKLPEARSWMTTLKNGKINPISKYVLLTYVSNTRFLIEAHFVDRIRWIEAQFISLGVQF